MSRIGKLPINLPSGISCSVSGGKVTVKGPKGELSQEIKPGFGVSVENGVITISNPSTEKTDGALHGLYRALIANMVEGRSIQM